MRMFLVSQPKRKSSTNEVFFSIGYVVTFLFLMSYRYKIAKSISIVSEQLSIYNDEVFYFNFGGKIQIGKHLVSGEIASLSSWGI